MQSGAFSEPEIKTRFDGRQFSNTPPTAHGGFRDALKWMLHRKRGPWRNWTDAPPGPPPPRRVGAGQLRVTFVNHSTTLIQMDGLNILTDPIWSRRSGPFPWLGVRRHRPPGLSLDDLPPIDILLLSHNHYDHLDQPTFRRLVAMHQPRVFTGLGNRALLNRYGAGQAQELEWWQSASLTNDLQLVAVPARHFSGRSLADRNRSLWAGFVLKRTAASVVSPAMEPGSPPASPDHSGAVYFAGDTGYGPHFAEIGRRLGPIRLALLPIGAFRPRWFMQPIHVDPEEAVRAAEDLHAATSIAIHYGTFRLGDDAENEPTSLLAEALAARNPRPQFWVLGFGEGRDVPPLPI